MSDGAAKILVVEDEMLLQESTKMILQSQGYNVSIAGDGLEAIAKLKSFKPNLVLLDYFMPRMDGKNFLENIDLEEYPDMKVVVTSNISDRSVVDELLRLGAHKYVLKASLSPTELLRVVDEMGL